MENPTQAGAVLIFKEGISKEEATKALEAIEHLLEPTFRNNPRVNTFNPEWGGPVWYVP